MPENTYNHPSIILAEFMHFLQDALVIAPMCAVDKTSAFTKRSEGQKVGHVVNIKTAGEYSVNEFEVGGGLTKQPMADSLRQLTIEKHFDVSIEFGAEEETLDIDSLATNFIQPAAYAMASKVDKYLGGKLMESAGLYTSDDLLGDVADVAQIRKAATLQQLDPAGRYAILDLDTEAKVLGIPAFNQAQTRGAEGINATRNGQIGTIMGIDWNASINFPTNSTPHTAGTGVAVTSNVEGKNGIGAMALDVVSSTGTVKVGDRISVAGCHRPLKVAMDVDLSAITTIPLIDPITEVIESGAGVSVIGSGTDLTYNGVVFDKRTLGVAFPMLPKTSGAESATLGYKGITIRAVKQYDINTKETVMSIDMLIGATILDPRRGTLLATSE